MEMRDNPVFSYCFAVVYKTTVAILFLSPQLTLFSSKVCHPSSSIILRIFGSPITVRTFSVGPQLQKGSNRVSQRVGPSPLSTTMAKKTENDENTT
jgi:hypothetical protein